MVARDSRKEEPGSRSAVTFWSRFGDAVLTDCLETACGAGVGGNAHATFREEKAPKGESQRRCRHETRPARHAREQAVERETKP
ncbi:hypothetical protein B7486_08805 [cyanobacterium TDX16]|nr:hypothetical protein B7486_08805 [cyanobacterium TDX16]